MKFGEEYGIFDSINETYCWLLRTHVEDQRGRDSIQWMQPYLSTLRKYAKRCSHITEFGINQCVSTWAFLAARPNKMVSVDIDLNRRATQYVPAFGRVNYWLISAIILSQREGMQYSVVSGDTALIDIEETDLLFIDTLHTKEHLGKELSRHKDKVRKYIIAHDTRLHPNLNIPLAELCETGEFKEIERIDTYVGLVVLERVSK